MSASSRWLIWLILALTVGCSRVESAGAKAKVFSVGVTQEVLKSPLRLAHSAERSSDSVVLIRDVLQLPDRSVWVIEDGAPSEAKDPRILVFDSVGTFVRQVGRAGNGTGEYTAPYGMALLKDGRVVVRDGGRPERVHIFKANGVVDSAMILDGRTGWPRDLFLQWGSGSPDPIRVDATGAAWLPYEWNSVYTDTGSSSAIRYVRVRPKGEFMGIVDSPDLPIIAIKRLASNTRNLDAALALRSVQIPNQPRNEFAWNPQGRFTIARTDVYQFEELEAEDVVLPGDSRTPNPAQRRRAFGRSASAVAVTRPERDSILAGIKRQLIQLHIDSNASIPAIPRTKPLIKHFRYSDDGQLIVWVSQPSVLMNGSWVEPQVVDLFNDEASLTARVRLPDSFRLLRLIGRTVWGVETDGSGHETAVRYSIQVPW